MENVDHYEHSFDHCSLNFACSSISGKWKPYIIWYLHDAPNGTCRYGELKRRVPYKISHKVFSQQLQELERDNIISKQEFDEKPLRVEYSLTEMGKLLVPVIFYLRDWGCMASSSFTQEDLLSRSRGTVENDTISYAYQSESLGKSVHIQLKY